MIARRVSAKMNQGRAPELSEHTKTRSRRGTGSDTKDGEVCRERRFGPAGRAEAGDAQRGRDEIRRPQIHDGVREGFGCARRIQMDVRRAGRLNEVRWMNVPAAIVIRRTRSRMRGIRLPRMIALLAMRWRCGDGQRGYGACRRAKGAVQHRHRKGADYGPRPKLIRAQHRRRNYTFSSPRVP